MTSLTRKETWAIEALVKQSSKEEETLISDYYDGSKVSIEESEEVATCYTAQLPVCDVFSTATHTEKTTGNNNAKISNGISAHDFDFDNHLSMHQETRKYLVARDYHSDFDVTLPSFEINNKAFERQNISVMTNNCPPPPLPLTRLTTSRFADSSIFSMPTLLRATTTLGSLASIRSFPPSFTFAESSDFHSTLHCATSLGHSVFQSPSVSTPADHYVSKIPFSTGSTSQSQIRTETRYDNHRERNTIDLALLQCAGFSRRIDALANPPCSTYKEKKLKHIKRVVLADELMELQAADALIDLTPAEARTNTSAVYNGSNVERQPNPPKLPASSISCHPALFREDQIITTPIRCGKRSWPFPAFCCGTTGAHSPLPNLRHPHMINPLTEDKVSSNLQEVSNPLCPNTMKQIPPHFHHDIMFENFYWMNKPSSSCLKPIVCARNDEIYLTPLFLTSAIQERDENLIAQIDSVQRTHEHLFANVSVSKTPCKCKNTNCLKLYCHCFQRSMFCDLKVCRCKGCKNTAWYSGRGGARAAAIALILSRRTDAFDVRIKKKVAKGCGCRKNRCIQKYCDCYNSKNKCTFKCRCTDCSNKLLPSKLSSEAVNGSMLYQALETWENNENMVNGIRNYRNFTVTSAFK